ncbi:MAG: AsmA family protein [Bacteroidia bacterium]|nr:MAG: AsmA family protein [Bacteroidia bacterium]
MFLQRYKIDSTKGAFTLCRQRLRPKIIFFINFTDSRILFHKRNKMAKKVIKVLFIVLATLLLLLIIVPYAFRGAIVERIKHEVNEQVDARVDFGKTRLSFIRNFPDITLSIHDILIVNEAPFEGETLADIGRLQITIDLRSLLGGDGYEIKRIRLDKPDLMLRYLKDGSANWDIIPPSEPKEETEVTEDFDFQLSLRRVDIRNGKVSYHDDAFLTYIDVDGLSGRFSGDLTMDVTNIATRNTHIESFSLRYDRFPVLSNVAARIVAEMEMDMRDWTFTFRENELLLNALPIGFDGVIGLPGGGGTMMDFSFTAARSDFGAFLSLIPALYADDFASLQTAGSLALHGSVNGLLKGESIPGFELALNIDDGMFSYPDLPAALSDVFVDARIVNTGNNADAVRVDVPVFRMNLAGNPVDARFAMRTPVSDPWIDLAINGKLDLSDIATFVPLEEGMLLEGLLESNMEARGHLSAIETGNYQNFHATGTFLANNVAVESAILPARFELHQMQARISPRHITIGRFQARMGDSDLSATGQIDNMLSYWFDDDLLRGRFTVESGLIHVNQLMAAIPEAEETDEPMTLSVIPVPANIDFRLQARIQRLVFGDMDIRDIRGNLQIVDEQAGLQDLSMGFLGGRLAMSGYYDTRGELPDTRFVLDFSNFDIAEAFGTLNTVGVLAPVAEYASGRISGGITINATLDESLRPVLETLAGSGRLSSSAIKIENYPSLVRLAERLRMDNFRSFDVRNVALRFSFADGKVDTDPFNIRFGESSARISGSTWFDQRIDYSMRMDIPWAQFGTQATEVLDGLIAQAAGRGIKVDPGDKVQIDVHIGGTVTNPELSVGMPGTVDAVLDRLKDQAERLVRDVEDRIRDEVDSVVRQAEDEIMEKIEDTREQLREDLEARAQQVVDEAERRAASIRREAARSAERVRQEAREQADRLLEEASGPVAVAAARRAGQALVSEADRRANQIENEADQRADQIIDEANARADRIRRGEE